MKEQLSIENEDDMMKWAFEHSSNAKLITGIDHKIRKVNKAFLALFGFSYDEVIGQNAGELLHSRKMGAELREQIIQRIESKDAWKGEVINYRKDGSEMPSLLSINAIKTDNGEKVGYLGIIIDLTEQKKLQAQILQSEKLSSIGESVATLMHEIRNPLSGISMNAFLLETREQKCTIENCKYTQNGEAESIRLISQEVKRLETLVKNALDYARDKQLVAENVSIKEFYLELQKLTSFQLKDNLIEMTIDSLPEEYTITIDPDMMKQVFINLIQNAIEAISDGCEPDCKVHRIRLGAFTEQGPDWRALSPSARVILLYVDNCGKKISSDIAKNLFKPFYTSKNKGVGLGLATSSKIIRQHHGILAHRDIKDPPFTTRFIIALPF